MNAYCPNSPSQVHTPEHVFVATATEHLTVLEFTCLFCDVRGTLDVMNRLVEWDGEEDDDDSEG